MRTILLAIASWVGAACLYAADFEREEIDSRLMIPYGVDVGDVDGDGKLDILLAGKRHFGWYQAPRWLHHTLARNITLRDNVCIAAEDIDGDGMVEIAVGSRWNPGNTIEPLASGSVHYLIRPKKDPTELWEPLELFHEPTVHRMRWVQGADSAFRLVVLPLHGFGNKGGKGELGVNVRTYRPNLAWPTQVRGWTHEAIDRTLHQAHNFDHQGSFVYVGGAEGIIRREVTDNSHKNALIISPQNSQPPCKGVGEVRKGEGFIAAIEPMHGTDLVTYTPGEEKGTWVRTLLTDQLSQGHALGVADLTSAPGEEIVVGWRHPNAADEMGIQIYSQVNQGVWQASWIDKNGIATEDIKLADLDGDGRIDIVASGRKTHNLVIYWNRS